jgi:zinc protease
MVHKLRIWIVVCGLLCSASLQAGPSIESWLTPNGAKVLYVHAPEIPMLDVRVVFDAGSARDGDQPGLTSFTNSLLNQGAGPWTAQQIAERMENAGANLSVGSLRDMAWVSLRTLSEQKAMKTALDTMAVVLSKPNFLPQDIERERKSIIASLLRDEQSPSSIGKKLLYRKVFGDHPYATPVEGDRETVKSIQREDLIQAHRRLYVARNAVVSMVGAIDRDQAETIARELMSGLAEGEHVADLPQVKPLDEAVEEKIDFPSAQAHLLIAQPGMKRGDRDYFPLYVGNHILGGSGLVSQLSEEVREKRGLSYSVYSYFLPMREVGLFQLGLQTKNAQVEEARQVVGETLKRFVTEGPSSEELQAAKQNITGGFPLRIASNGKIVEYLSVIGFYGLPLDYLDVFTGKVEAVTTEQIRDAFQRRIHPPRMVTVVVGRHDS